MRTEEIGSVARSSDQTAAVVYALGLLEASGPILDSRLVIGTVVAGRMIGNLGARSIALASLRVRLAAAMLIVSC
jgi:hypothetical protein